MKRRQTPCANPLFEKWLEEWKEFATQRDMPIQYNYAKALFSLRQCPFVLESGKACLIIRNFGPKLCDMLDKKLDQYKAQNNLPSITGETLLSEPEKPGGKARKVDKQNVEKNNKTKKSPNALSRPYIPKIGSASYAILVTLYKKSMEPDYIGFMYKKDIITEAQADCECEMKSNALQHYAGWSSMSTLIEKNLVVRKSSPAKFSLTDAGLALAISLYESKSAHPTNNEQYANNSISFPSTSKSNGLKNSETTFSKMKPPEENKNDIVNLLDDDDDDDVFQQCFEETEKAKLCEKLKNKEFDKFKIQNPSSPDDEYNEFCKENPEPLITVKKKEQHFLFTKIAEIDNNPISDVNNKTNSQDFIKAHQNKIEAVNEGNGKILKNSQQKRMFVDDILFKPFFLMANNFDIILLVDTQEICGGKTKSKDDATISELNKHGILYEIRSLKVGDFLWIARCRLTHRELVLPYIVERKRMDDLSSSIKDGRYHEQKFRLRQSGINNVIYMVENYDSIASGSIPLTALLQAAVNSLIQDNFDVKFTKNHRDSMHYLNIMTKKLTNNFQSKELQACSKKDLQPGKLMEFNEFNKAAIKTKNYKVQEMLIRQLIQLKGLSIDKAAAIAEFYPTPKILAEAYHQGDDKLLADIELGLSKRKVGSSVSKTLYQLYTKIDLV